MFSLKYISVGIESSYCEPEHNMLLPRPEHEVTKYVNKFLAPPHPKTHRSAERNTEKHIINSFLR